MVENAREEISGPTDYKYYVEFWESDDGEALKSLRRKVDDEEDSDWDPVTVQNHFSMVDLERVKQETVDLWAEVERLRAAGEVVQEDRADVPSHPRYIYWIDRWTDSSSRDADNMAYLSLKRDEWDAGANDYFTDDFFDYNTIPDIDVDFLMKELQGFDDEVSKLKGEGYEIEEVGD